MNEPEWLGRTHVEAVQESLLQRFGGLAGLRDEGLLELALARPRQLWSYGKPSLFDLAASYAHGQVKNYPFLDGNKRIGFLAAYIFLRLHGHEVSAPETEVVLFTLGLAAGEVSEEEYAAWLKKSCS